MKELFSLCSVVLLLGTSLSAIILTESAPSVIQISSNKYIISIDEPIENTSQVKKIAAHQITKEQTKSTTESSSIVATRIVESQQTGHSQTVTSNDIVKQYAPEPSSISKPSAQANIQKKPTLNATLPSSEGSSASKGSNSPAPLVSQPTTITPNKSANQNAGGQALPAQNSATPSSPQSTSTSVSTSNTPTTNMPTLGLVQAKPASPMVGLANPNKL